MTDNETYRRLLLALLMGTALLMPRAATAQAPAVALSATSLTFASQYPTYYTSPPMSVTLTNSGTAPLTVSNISLGGVNPGDFTITAGGGAATLDPGASQTITLTFTPAAVGSRSATVSIASDAPSSPNTIALDGTGLEPAFEIAVSGTDTMAPFATLTFPDTMVGLTSPVVKSFTLTNVGTGSGTFLAIGWTGGAGFGVVSNTGPATLLPGQSRTVSISFSPSSVGTNSANMVATVRDDYRGAEISAVVVCYGNGLREAVTLSPTSLDFGGQVKGTTGSPLSATLTNNQSVALSITGASLSGANPGDFTITAGGGTGSLGPGASRTITLTFTPTAFGGRSATLVVTTDAPDSPHTVSLVGDGRQPSLQIAVTGTDPGFSGAALAFPDTPVGTTCPLVKSFGVKNVGTASGTVCCLWINAPGFQVVAESGPAVIFPGDTHTFTIAFTPGITGLNYAHLGLQVNDDYWVGVNKPVGVDLYGNGVGPPVPAVSMNPASLRFGNQAVGTTSAAQSVILKNSGNAPLTVSNIALGGANPGSFAIVAGGSGGTLAPGASQSITVTFSPPAVGPHSAILTITDDAAGSPHQVPVDGVGFVPAPAVSLSPTSLSFGNELLGTTSAPQSVTLTNSGTAPLNISGISLSGANPGSFSITAGGSGGTLGPGSSRSISITFSPGATGPLSANLAVTDDATGSPHQVSLTGNGVPPAPAVSLSPASLDFGNQAIGTTSAARSVTLTNSGTAPLTVGSINLSGANPGSFAIASGGSTGTLAPGASQSVSMTFTPSSTGSFSASLSVVSDAPGSPHSVSLIGAGGAPAINVSRTSLDFGLVDLGRTATQSITLTNTGTAPLSINSINRSGDPDFSAGGGGMTLQPGESRGLNVSFAPVTVGARHGSLSISHNAGGSPATVSLTGTGTNPPPPPPGTPLARVSPTNLDFGRQTVGSTGSPQTVMLSNPGTAALTIAGVSLSGANPGDFRLDGSAGTVAAGSQSGIQISFAPTAPGVRSALLSIRHNAGSSPDTVTLTGTGTPGGTPPPTSSAPIITGYAATNPRGVAIFSAPPGAPLLVEGKNLGTSGALAFNGVPAPLTLSWSPTEILVIVPAAPIYAFQGPVTVTLRDQSAAGPPFTITLPKVASAPARDWPVFMHDPRQLGLADSALDPRTLSHWSVPLGSHPASAPVLRGGVAYIGTEAGDVFAIDTATHAVRWQQRLPGPVRAAPAAGETAIVVSAGALYGLNAADGTLLWQRQDLIPNDGVAPMLVDNTVYIGARVAGATNRIIYALDTTTGAGVWPLAFTLPDGIDTRATAAAFPELGLLVVGLGPPAVLDPPGAGPGSVIGLRLADGSAAWPAPVALPLGPPPGGLSLGWAEVPLGSTTGVQPALFAAVGGTVAARNAATGAPLWNRSLPETTLLGPPVVSATSPRGATLFLAGASGHLYALNSNTGADALGAWTSSPPLARPVVGPLALAGNYLYAPTTDGLIVFDATTGKQFWSSPLSLRSGVAVAGGSPYVTTTDDLLVGFSAGSITPPPVVVHDVAITRLQAPPRVSRQTDAQVQVTIANRGTQAEQCNLLLRVQPGRVLIASQALTLAAGETKSVTISWPTPLMGEDGPKSLVADLSLQGQTDSNPANNQAIQLVTVGP